MHWRIPSSKSDRRSSLRVRSSYRHSGLALVGLSVVVMGVRGAGGAVSTATPSPSQIGIRNRVLQDLAVRLRARRRAA